VPINCVTAKFQDLGQQGFRAFELLIQSNIRRITYSEISNLSTALQQLRRETVYVHVDVDVLDVSEGRANDWRAQEDYPSTNVVMPWV